LRKKRGMDPTTRNGKDGAGPLVLQVLMENGGREVRSFPPEKGAVSLGRSLESDLVLQDRRVSRRHCRIEVDQDGRWVLLDEGSQNGTRVNGVLVSRQVLRAGDSIQLGKTRISVLQAGEEEEGATRVEETVLAKEAPPKERLLALMEINRALNAELRLEKLLGIIVDSALELIGGERGFLLLDEGGGLNCKVARDATGKEIPPGEVRFSRRLAEEVRSTRVPRLAADALGEEDLKAIQSVVDLGVRSVLCVPLTVRGKVEGVLYVDHRVKVAVFTESDLDLLQAFADQAGIALANARLYQDLVRRKEELEATTKEVERLNAALREKVARQEEELLNVRKSLSGGREEGFAGMIGKSPAMCQVFSTIRSYLDSPEPVLIEGESGTGKELVARAIHKLGPRSSGPFVTENCAAIPTELLESELFGYTKGAFTGAVKDRKGLFEAAHGGILFLDEVGEMPQALQKKLLRVLQEGEIRPLGSSRTVQVDVRVVAAANRPLKDLVREGKFREDLFYRLHVLPLRLPPLRERREDIPLLVEHFLAKAAGERGLPALRVSTKAMDLLVSYPWPGNVRQLENELKRAAILAEAGEVRPEHLSPEVRYRTDLEGGAPLPGGSLPEKVKALQVREILSALRKRDGNKSRAAADLGISRFSLQRLMDKYGILGPGEEEGKQEPS